MTFRIRIKSEKLGPIRCALCCFALGFTFLAAQDAPPIAILNGTAITRQEYGAYLIETQGKRPVRGLISRKLVAREAEQLGIHIDEPTVQASFDEIWALQVERWQGDLDKATEELGKQGFSLADYRVLVEGTRRHDLLSDAICRATRNVTEAAIKERFEAEYGPRGRREEVRHIFLATNLVVQELRDSDAQSTPAKVHAEMERQIAELLARLRAGVEFEKLCSEHSHDSTSSGRGGKLTQHGIARYGEPFARGIRSAAVGLPVGPIFTAQGAHLLEVTERVKTRLEDVRVGLSERLKSAPADYAELGELEQRLFDAAKIEGL